MKNAVQRMQGLIRMLKDASERWLNTRTSSSDPIFLLMVEWSAGLISRRVKGQQAEPRTEARGHDARAPVAEFGQAYVHDVKEHEQEWGQNEECLVNFRDAERSDRSKDRQKASRGSKMVR